MSRCANCGHGYEQHGKRGRCHVARFDSFETVEARCSCKKFREEGVPEGMRRVKAYAIVLEGGLICSVNRRIPCGRRDCPGAVVMPKGLLYITTKKPEVLPHQAVEIVPIRELV